MPQMDTPLSITKNALLQGFLSLGLEELSLAITSIIFEKPADATHGDWACPTALTLFKAAQAANNTLTNPRQFAELVVAATLPTLATEPWFESMNVAGPGFINVTFSDEFYITKMLEMAQNRAVMPLAKNTAKTAIVEYSSPNIAKPFTIGHLRSTIIGAAVANLLEATGYTVLRDNHLGDWGTQFGKQIYAIKHLGEGSQEANIAKISAAENPVKELVALYVEFHQKAEEDPTLEDRGREWFTKLEQGDKEARALWQQCIDWSFVEFENIYQQLGVEFYPGFAGGRGLGESFFEDKMDVVLNELETHLAPKELYQESKGAKLVFFPDEEFPPLMIIKNDGSTLYATRDLATDYYRRQQFGDDLLVVNEVGAEQSLYFKQLYRTEELLGWYQPGQRVHVAHGLYRFKDKKMSTRKGNVIWLEEVLEEAQKRALALAKAPQNVESTGASADEAQALATSNAQKIGIGALKWNDLKRSARLNVSFDWDEILTMQGNSGPYMQYTYARTQSILDKAKSSTSVPIDTVLSSMTYDQQSLIADEKNIVRLIAEYFDVVSLAATSFAPHHLCTYLYELAQAFNSFYTATQIVEVGTDGLLTPTSHFRVVLTATVGMVLKNGLQIIGIETVRQM